MTKKYKLDENDTITVDGRTLYRIIALIAIGTNVPVGDKGGYVETENNLSHSGDAWVFDDARVYGNAQVSGDAQVFGNVQVSGNAQVYGNAWVYGNAQVYGNAWVSENARVSENAKVYGNAWVYGNAQVSGDAQVYDNVKVYGNAQVYGNAWVYGNAQVSENAQVFGNVQVSGNAQVYDNVKVYGNAQVYGNADYFCAQSFGSRGGTTTFFHEKSGWRVKCGCFYGTVEEFRTKVKQTHGDSLIAQEYLLIADLMDLRIKRRVQEASNG